MSFLLMKIKKFYRYTLINLFFLWIALSFSRTIYNVIKIPAQEKMWFYLSEDQKKATYYGDIYIIYNYLQKNTKTSDLLYIQTHEDIAYFLLRYLLYPHKIFRITLTKELPKNSHYYLIEYHNPSSQHVVKLFGRSSLSYY